MVESGIYRDDYLDNLLPIVVVTQNSFDRSISNIAFVICFVIAEKSSR